MDDAAEEMRERDRGGAEGKHQARVQEYEVEGLRLDSLNAEHDRELEEVAKRYRPVATVEQKRGNIAHTGSPNEIRSSDEIDLRSLKSLELRISRRWEDGCALNMDKNGATLVLTSRPTWVRKTRAELETEIRRNVPWWSYLRTRRASIVAGLGLTAVLGLAVSGTDWLRIVDKDGNGVSRSSAWSTYATMAAFVSVALGALYWWTVRALLPGFEILEDGVQSKGRRAVGLIGGFLASVVASLIAGLIAR